MRLTLLLSLFVFFGTTDVFGEMRPIIGNVTKIRGEAIRLNKSLGLKNKLRAGVGILEGDLIKTGAKSYLKILMKDDSVLQIGPNSAFGFDQFDLRVKKGKKKAERKKAQYFLGRGSIRSIFTKSKEKNIVIKTKMAAMGIRGTEILAESFRLNKKDVSEFYLIRGNVEVEFFASHRQGKKQKLALSPGEFFTTYYSGAKQESGVQRVPSSIAKVFERSSKKGGAIFLKDVKNQVAHNVKEGLKEVDEGDLKKSQKKVLEKIQKASKLGVVRFDEVLNFSQSSEAQGIFSRPDIFIPSKIENGVQDLSLPVRVLESKINDALKKRVQSKTLNDQKNTTFDSIIPEKSKTDKAAQLRQQKNEAKQKRLRIQSDQDRQIRPGLRTLPGN